jgi:hypothetical protein
VWYIVPQGTLQTCRHVVSADSSLHISIRVVYRRTGGLGANADALLSGGFLSAFISEEVLSRLHTYIDSVLQWLSGVFTQDCSIPVHIYSMSLFLLPSSFLG